MEGYTDSAWRQLARQNGADVVYTEFISSDAIGRNARTAVRKMAFDPSEQPVICQIFGRDPEYLAAAAKEIERRGFAGVDLNFGCPARKVVSGGMGVALLRDPRYARELIERVLAAVTIPVSVKLRASIRKERPEVTPGAERVTAVELVEAIADLPVAAIMVHGRSFEQGFTGSVDYDIIRGVKERFRGLVLANGGIQTTADAIRLLEKTGVDGVGVARGAVGRPWFFRDLRAALAGHEPEPHPWAEVERTILTHATLVVQSEGERGLLELRKHLSHYIRGVPGGGEIRARLVRASTVADIRSALAEVNQ